MPFMNELMLTGSVIVLAMAMGSLWANVHRIERQRIEADQRITDEMILSIRAVYAEMNLRDERQSSFDL